MRYDATNPVDELSSCKIKSFQIDEDGYEGGWDYARAEGTKIDWKEDKDLTKEYEIRKQRNKSELALKCFLVPLR